MSNEPSNDINDENSSPADEAHAPGSIPPPAPTVTLTPPPIYVVPAARPNQAKRVVAVLAVAALAVMGTVIVSFLLILAVGIGAAIGLAAEIDVEQISHTPTSYEDIPSTVAAVEAEVVIDLSQLSASDFEDGAEPLNLDVDVEFGSVEIIVPESVIVDVNAENQLGEIDVFESNNDGFDNRVVHDGGTNPDLEINIDMEVGDIDVHRG